jgi:plasmid stabilization system protein ParE
MTAIAVTGAAEEQLRDIVEWWTIHRDTSPQLVMDEFERCVALLKSSPDAGVRFHRARAPGVRRLIMRRTKHHVHDDANAIVYILAVWGAPKVGYPVLIDPRR